MYLDNEFSQSALHSKGLFGRQMGMDMGTGIELKNTVLVGKKKIQLN